MGFSWDFTYFFIILFYNFSFIYKKWNRILKADKYGKYHNYVCNYILLYTMHLHAYLQNSKVKCQEYTSTYITPAGNLFSINIDERVFSVHKELSICPHTRRIHVWELLLGGGEVESLVELGECVFPGEFANFY